MRARSPVGLLPLLIITSACGTGNVQSEAQVPQIAERPFYLPADIVSTIDVTLPAPRGSPRDDEDVKVLKALQKSRTPADCGRAQAEAQPVNPAYAEFFGSMSPIPVPLHGEARDLVIHVWSDASLVSEALKKQFRVPRAYDAEPELQPCVPKTTSWAFPSGHTLTSRVFALLLSDLDPAKRTLYLQRADEIAQDRVIAGMHRPSEIEAAKALADEIYAKLDESDAFRSDLSKLRASLPDLRPKAAGLSLSGARR